MGKNSNLPKILFGVFYGALIAVAYLFGKHRGAVGGLDLLTYGCFVTFALHLMLSPKSTMTGLTNPKMCFRGVLWGLTQVFIFAAQKNGQTSSALVGAVMGSIFGILLGRIFLKERLSLVGFGAAILALAAVFVDPLLFKSAAMAIPGGFIQGLSVVTARSLMLERKSISQSISTGFFVGGLVGIVAMTLLGLSPSAHPGLTLDIAIVVAMLLVIQYSYFYLIRLFDTQRASILLLTRIPWAFALEAALYGASVSGRQMLAGVCIIGGSLLLLLESFVALSPRTGR